MNYFIKSHIDVVSLIKICLSHSSSLNNNYNFFVVNATKLCHEFKTYITEAF